MPKHLRNPKHVQGWDGGKKRSLRSRKKFTPHDLVLGKTTTGQEGSPSGRNVDLTGPRGVWHKLDILQIIGDEESSLGSGHLVLLAETPKLNIPKLLGA